LNVASAEHERELLRLIKGSPQPEVGVQGLAERMGCSIPETQALIDELLKTGRLVREGDRIVVAERAASAAEPEQEVP
jgi:hypothetical protein